MSAFLDNIEVFTGVKLGLESFSVYELLVIPYLFHFEVKVYWNYWELLDVEGSLEMAVISSP